MPSSLPYHLTYCTNIHPGESWEEVQRGLLHTLAVRELAGGGPFGIGLRLSARAAEELSHPGTLAAFRRWLEEHGCYVFAINGFPYGGFHGRVVKDRVHAPDWTTRERVDYTQRLFDILASLLPDGLTGGVSTSPVSYGPWHTSSAAVNRSLEIGAYHLAAVIDYLAGIHERTGKLLHLDIEPEPDGLLEDSATLISFYRERMLREGLDHLRKRRPGAGEALIRRHLRLCYDVCHYAVMYEEPAGVLRQLRAEGIKVGRLQISAPLKTFLTDHSAEAVRDALAPYDEPTYLHQATLRHADGRVVSYPDLEAGMRALDDPGVRELRTHFHVPIYTDSYGLLRSTSDAITECLRLWREDPYTRHLEVETYTWDVLPNHQRLGLVESIHRELEWVRRQL